MSNTALEEKVAEVRAALELWAEDHQVLGPDEKLDVRVRVMRTAPVEVAPLNPVVLDLLVPDFFTSERLVSIGCPKHLANRLAKLIHRAGRKMQGDYRTVREFAKDWEDEWSITNMMKGVGQYFRLFLIPLMREVWKLV